MAKPPFQHPALTMLSLIALLMTIGWNSIIDYSPRVHLENSTGYVSIDSETDVQSYFTAIIADGIKLTEVIPQLNIWTVATDKPLIYVISYPSTAIPRGPPSLGFCQAISSFTKQV